jgi:hypothetical protein
MQGFSHFQIISGMTDGYFGYCDMISFVTSKNDTNIFYTGHTGVTSDYWEDRSYSSMTYDASEDAVYLDTRYNPLTKEIESTEITGLSVYIRLFNVEEK